MAPGNNGSGNGDAFATVNGNALRYRLRGDEGPLVVFGHGLMGSIEQIDEGAGAFYDLLARVRLLLYDARGHGQSGGPDFDQGYTWETLGRDMVGLLDFEGEERGILGGASMGAGSALWVAIEQPERVKALTIMMPPPLGPVSMRTPEERQALQVLDLLSAAVQNFGVQKTLEIARMVPGFAATPEEAEERAKMLLALNPLTLLHAIRGLLQAPVHDPEAYQRIRVPTLVLAHEGDGLHPIRAAQLLAENVPDCRLLVGPEPDYWQHHPEELRAEFASFLDYIGE